LKYFDFYFITDSGLSRNGVLEDVKSALRAGCQIIQYREKEKPVRKMIEEAQAIKELCSGKALFLVNDNVDVALAVDSDGIHVGQEDIPLDLARKLLGKEKIIGITVHNVPEALQAVNFTTDYIALSPIFHSSTKKNAGNPCGVEMIRKVKEVVDVPIVAIGGIDKENVTQVLQSGADSIACISSILNSDNICQSIMEFRDIIKKVRE